MGQLPVSALPCITERGIELLGLAIHLIEDMICRLGKKLLRFPDGKTLKRVQLDSPILGLVHLTMQSTRVGANKRLRPEGCIISEPPDQRKQP